MSGDQESSHKEIPVKKPNLCVQSFYSLIWHVDNEMLFLNTNICININDKYKILTNHRLWFLKSEKYVSTDNESALLI